ncbi:ABC multidrug transporter Mdr1 [Phyllosticta capitalensis]
MAQRRDRRRSFEFEKSLYSTQSTQIPSTTEPDADPSSKNGPTDKRASSMYYSPRSTRSFSSKSSYPSDLEKDKIPPVPPVPPTGGAGGQGGGTGGPPGGGTGMPPGGQFGDPIAMLPPNEQEVLRRQLETPSTVVTYLTCFRYAERREWIILSVACVMAMTAGATLPLMTIIFGHLSGVFRGLFAGQINQEEFHKELRKYVLYFVYLGLGSFASTYTATVGCIYVGERITLRIRENYLAAILRQNVGYFDKIGAGEVTTRITFDSNLVQDGISEKITLVITSLSTFMAAFVIGFIRFWKLTLILCATLFSICISMGIGTRYITQYTKNAIFVYAQSGTVAEEVIGSIRNAVAFGTREKLADQFCFHLDTAEYWGTKTKTLLAMLVGIMMGIVFCSYSLAFWQGSRYLVDDDMTIVQIITVLMAVMIGSFSLGNVNTWIQSFTNATAAAAKIYSTIDRPSPMDPASREGRTLPHVMGRIDLKDVKMIYPSRPAVVVMNGVNLSIEAGKSTALVGASGSGKTTIVGLVERFYDPVRGNVYLDGNDVSELNLHWLRQNISLVQQEPVLFSGTIFENIRHGLIGTPAETMKEEKVQDMVYDAARISNAYDFVAALPDGFDTNVGQGGFLLSGGQKQRVAIARAIVKDPKILLLDEATSALDTKSEAVVQDALDRVSKGRTTIIIAHRLSTIKSADKIVVMSNGCVVEEGTHNQLIEKGQAYFQLVQAQTVGATGANIPDDDFDEDEELAKRVSSFPKANSMAPDDNGNLGLFPMRPLKTHESISSMRLAEKKDDEREDYPLGQLITMTAKYNKEEWHIMLLGIVWSVIAGSGNPVSAVFYAKAVTALAKPPWQFGQLRDQINFWCIMYVMLAATQFFALAGQGLCFAICSEKLIHRVRERAFRQMLRQDIEFFDDDENNSGALTTFLSVETSNLAGLSGPTLGTIMTVLTTLIGCLSLGLAIGWKLGLVCLSCIPILLGCGFLRFWVLSRFEARSKKAYKNSAAYACEATNAIKTVASLTREQDVWLNYHEQLEKQSWENSKSILKSSLLFAASQSGMFLCTAVGFYYGGTLIGKQEYTLFQFFLCFASITFGSQSAGTIFSFAPDMGKAKQSAIQLKKLFDRKPVVDAWATDGERLKGLEGDIEFRDVHFRYPKRPDQPVLRGLNLKVKPGQYIALVGASGCGKSTTIGLLERFYDPLAGGVFVDGKNITRYNINDYRRQLALVSQEPTLYRGTIRDNLMLGMDNEEVSDKQVEAACRQANIWDFISSLPYGFHTFLGTRGSLLSGGQRQRICIARALLRNPRILLLDEATSALDSESEKVVQAALDRAAQGRTTIAVAHRLSTIQKADRIYVFEGGRVVEEGTHTELTKKRGRYFELANMQNLEKHG